MNSRCCDPSPNGDFCTFDTPLGALLEKVNEVFLQQTVFHEEPKWNEISSLTHWERKRTNGVFGRERKERLEQNFNLLRVKKGNKE